MKTPRAESLLTFAEDALMDMPITEDAAGPWAILCRVRDSAAMSIALEDDLDHQVAAELRSLVVACTLQAKGQAKRAVLR